MSGQASMQAVEHTCRLLSNSPRCQSHSGRRHHLHHTECRWKPDDGSWHWNYSCRNESYGRTLFSSSSHRRHRSLVSLKNWWSSMKILKFRLRSTTSRKCLALPVNSLYHSFSPGLHPVLPGRFSGVQCTKFFTNFPAPSFTPILYFYVVERWKVA